MILQPKDLEIGDKFIYKGRNIKIVKIDKDKPESIVFYEYFIRGDLRDVDHCPAREFCDGAYWDYSNDPKFKDIYPYLFSKRFKSPELAANLLIRKLKINGKRVPVIDVITFLVKEGYLPAKRDSSKGLYGKGKYLSTGRLTRTGYSLAKYLCRENGWDGIPVELSDI